MELEKMTNEELIVLAKTTGDEYIKNYFFERNLKLAHFVSNKFSNVNKKKQHYDEIFSSTTLGLVKAYNAYDPESGKKFTTFAHTVMVNEVLLQLRFDRKDDKYRFISTSLPVFQGEDEDAIYIEDVLEIDEVGIDKRTQFNLDSERIISKLDERETKIYDLMFRKGYTQTEVGKELGIKQANLSRLVLLIKNKIREELTA